MSVLSWYNRLVPGVLVPLCLALVGGYFAVRLRDLWLHPVRLWRRMMTPQRSGGISPRRALSLALAGVLGVGNLVGVAGAISYGGAGAVLWMWVSATVAMMLKYAEIVLALHHRRWESGTLRGSAMYYIEDGCRRHPRAGKVVGALFAALCLIDAVCMGCMIQINAVSTAWHSRLSVPLWVTGLLLAVGVLWVGLRGADGVSAVTERIVPLMTVGFCLLSLLAIGRRAGQVPAVLARIVSEGLRGTNTAEAAAAGVGGFLFSRALRYGTMRGLLSNEAGCGTSPMAHADAHTTDAVAQGGMGIVEVLVDTHLLCTMTALVILLAFGGAVPALPPMLLTVAAFEQLLGRWAGVFLCVAVLFFGLATVLCWSDYMRRAAAYLFPFRTRAEAGVRGGVCLLLYALFCLLGAYGAPAAVWELSDFAIGSMTVINVLFLWKSRREIIALTASATPNTRRTSNDDKSDP